ncbi:MAG TPA: hypothetical protein VMA75_00970 [Candidatus Paceibacterota bacterium]|nr:hypothetical protein [Candidatus Paceibacterota bacterium]
MLFLMVAGLLVWPAGIKADTAILHPQSTTAEAYPNAVLAVAPIATVANAPETKTVWVTAYTSDPDETSDHPLITASGAMVHDGVVADNLLPFGTEIEIPALFGNKIFTVEDRTSEKFTGRVDIWMPTRTEAVDFGIQKAQIVVLDAPLAVQ